MKRLMTCLAAAVAVLTASARIVDKQSFEETFGDFNSRGGEDDSSLVAYDNDGPAFAAPYDFSGFGAKYLSIDTGDATLWRTNTVDEGNVYFDMAMKFMPTAAGDEPDAADNKIVVYQNAESNIVVVAGASAADRTATTYTTTTKLDAGTWARLTISAERKTGETGLFFKVYLGGTLLTDGTISEFPSLTADTTVNEVGFSGSGALDNFIARTTDPFNHPASYVASVGGSDGEYYATFADALADGHETVTIKGNPFRTADGEAYDAESNPYVIANVEDLLALMYAVKSDAAARSRSYVQTADIDMGGIASFPGIGVYNATATSGTPFTGTYDGGNFKISNIAMTARKYAGIFNQVNGATIKNLTVENIGFESGATGEHGCAIVGNGVATLENLTAMSSNGFAVTNTHNVGGIMVRVAKKSGYTTSFNNCTNLVDIFCDRDKAGGICCFAAGSVAFTNCLNSGDYTLVARAGYADSGKNGFAGIIGYAQDGATVSMKSCVNAGAFVDADNLGTAVSGQLFAFPSESSTIELVDLGGNQFDASASGGAVVGSEPTAKFTVEGFKYATVAGDVGTTVVPADFVAGNTYTLLRDVAASETPVFTLQAAADTIAFKTNGFEFAGTVAVDTATLAGPVSTVEGDVITYSATAGVAAVDGVAYATFAEAVAAIAVDDDPDTDDYVTLLADVSTTLAAGDTLRVKKNSHTFTPSYASDVLLSDSTDANGITTFTAVVGVAAVTISDGTSWTWYASFAAAYDAALAASGYPSMKVRLTGDFTPDISTTCDDFYSLTFEDVRADQTEGLTINLKNSAGTAYMKSSRYFFPANATLVLAADWEPWQTGLATGGTLEIPETVTVAISGSYNALAGLTNVIGSGTISMNAETGDYLLSNPNTVIPTSLRASSWTGTLELTGTHEYVWSLDSFGNANSTIRFNGLTTYLNSGAHAVNVELAGGGLTVNGGYASGTWAFTGDLTGSGALNVAIVNTAEGSQELKKVQFTGDVSGFTGNVSLSSSAAQIEFGATTLTSGGSIIVGNGSSVTNTGVWTANNLVVLGELVANGTMTLASGGKLWGDTGTGVYRANSAAAAVVAAGSWKGTYIIGYDLSAATALNNFGSHADATIVFDGTTSGSFWIGSGKSAYTVVPTLRLDKDLVIRDGLASASDEYLLTFSKIAGTGSLTTKTTGDVTGKTIRYRINTLENYSGTLNVSDKSVVTIDKVNVAELPADGTRVVKTAVGATGSINDNVPLYVANVDSGKTLTYDASGADGAGLYLAGSTPVYPTYVGTDTTLQSQYDAWLTAFKKPDTASANKTAFLLNVDPDTGDKTLDVTVIAISGTTVTITIDHEAVNGYPYVKSAATLEGLSSATPAPATVVDGVITLPSQTGTATFYRVGVSSTPIDNN